MADDLDHLAMALTLAERLDEALAASDRALAIKERALEESDVRIARTLESRGLILQRRGDYPGARLALQRALLLRDRADPTHPERAGTLSLLGDQSWFEGDLREARQLSERALAVAEKALRLRHPDIASYLRSLAVPVGDLGDWTEARVLRERALEIAEESLGSDHPSVAVQLNDLASTLLLQGEYATARPLYERALSLYEHRLGPDHSSVTTVRYNLAHLYAGLGGFAEARQQFDRVIATWARVLGPEHPLVARAVAALAEMMAEQGLDAEATALYQRALAIREGTLGAHHRDVARTLSYLSTSISRLGQIRRAHELSSRALGIWEQSGILDSRDVADALVIHGTIQGALGDHVKARASYDRASVLLRRIVGPTHPDVAKVHGSLATALMNLGQPSEALRYALEAEAIGRDHLRLTLRHLPERQGLEYAAKRPRGLNVALSLLHASSASADVVLDAVIRSRTLMLDEMAARRHTGTDHTRSDLAPLWASLGAARQRLANLVVRGPVQQQPGQYLALVEEARRDKEAAERSLAERSARFRAELAQSEIGLDAIRATLPPQSALVSFVRYDRTTAGRLGSIASYLALVARPESDPIAVPLGSAEDIDRLVAAWRQETVAGFLRFTRSPLTTASAHRLAGARLRQRIWDPVAVHMHGVSKVFVVPDGALHLVPLAALPTGSADYLLETGPTIHYMSSERDVVPASAPPSPGQGLFALGGPAFGDDAILAGPGSLPPTMAEARRGDAGASCGTLQALHFQPLPGSHREATEVSAFWNQFGARDTGPAQLRTDQDANEQAFKRYAPGHRVLHLATHGFFLGDACSPWAGSTRSVGGLTTAVNSPPRAAVLESPLLLSGLALAGANRRGFAGPEQEDGILTAEEVASLNLEGVEWAVLSACDTGLGEVRVGEGVFGLRRAFQVAGTRTVIMSLWPVDDEAARQWMHSLYQGRFQKRLDTAEAVREASLTVLRDRRERGLGTHPFYWAGFVAAGDWR